MKKKILCLGNEFIKDDRLAKEISKDLQKKLSDNFQFININDSFQLIEYIRNIKKDEEMIILDVVQNLKEVKFLNIQDLKSDSITNAHDFDAGFFLQILAGESEKLKDKIKIVGIPMETKNKEEMVEEVGGMLETTTT